MDSSIVGVQSASRELSRLVLKRLVAADVDVDEITYRDLVAEHLPHFDAVTAPSAHTQADAAATLDPEQQRQRENSNAMLREFMAADAVVICVPMYNGSIPLELKAWLDRIIVPGSMFRYHEGRPEGLAGGMRVVLEILRGGLYGPRSENDILCPL